MYVISSGISDSSYRLIKKNLLNNNRWLEWPTLSFIFGFGGKRAELNHEKMTYYLNVNDDSKLALNQTMNSCITPTFDYVNII